MLGWKNEPPMLDDTTEDDLFKKRKKLARALYLPMTKKQATKNKPKRHQKASILTELLMDGAASEVFISGPNGFFYHRRPDGTITKREGIKR